MEYSNKPTMLQRRVARIEQVLPASSEDPKTAGELAHAAWHVGPGCGSLATSAIKVLVEAGLAVKIDGRPPRYRRPASWPGMRCLLPGSKCSRCGLREMALVVCGFRGGR